MNVVNSMKCNPASTQSYTFQFSYITHKIGFHSLPLCTSTVFFVWKTIELTYWLPMTLMNKCTDVLLGVVCILSYPTVGWSSLLSACLRQGRCPRAQGYLPWTVSSLRIWVCRWHHIRPTYELQSVLQAEPIRY